MRWRVLRGDPGDARCPLTWQNGDCLGPHSASVGRHLADAIFSCPGHVSASFSEPNLIASAGLVPLVRLAERCGLAVLICRHVDLGVSTGANPAGKALSLVGGMCVGADSIDDMDVLRSGGISRLFGGIYAPSTLGSFLRTFTPGTCASCRPPPAGSPRTSPLTRY
jgi:hypothetical protein